MKEGQSPQNRCLAGARSVIAPLPNRNRGFGLIEVILALAAVIGASAGGVAVYSQARDNSVMNEALQSMTAVKSIVEPKLDTFVGKDRGIILDRLGIEKLPGFKVTEQGRFAYNWAANGVTFSNLGNAVVRFSLDGIDAKRCAKLSSRLFSAAVTPGYRSYLMIGTKLFDNTGSHDGSALAALCTDGADVGLVFARTSSDVRNLGEFDSVPADVIPPPGPAPVAPGSGEVPIAPGNEGDANLPIVTSPGTPDPVPVPQVPAQHVDFYLGPETWPGGWGSSPGWGPTVTSNWINTQSGGALVGNQAFKMWGDGNPTIQMANGTRASEGMLSPWGTNIMLDTPPCGGKSTVYIELENKKVYAYELTRPDWPSSWGARPASCG